MALTETIRQATIRQAKASGIEPAALLAVVEIESNGAAFESADLAVPRLLFERHVFYRQLGQLAPNKLRQAEVEGLTRKKWDRATQYKDQGTSKNRLALIARARRVHEEAANRSASWGLGQTMGFNYKTLGFPSATAMVKAMASVDVQIRAMVGEIRKNRLDRALLKKDWATFARGYNGSGYRANQYDTKLAAAYGKWKAALDPDDVETGDEPIDLPETRQAPPDPEDKPLIKSKTTQAAGTVAAVEGADVGIQVDEALTKAHQAGEVASTFGILDALKPLLSNPRFWVAVLSIVLCVGVIYWRWKDHGRGRA